jgi:hypothetical protein
LDYGNSTANPTGIIYIQALTAREVIVARALGVKKDKAKCG